MSKKSNNNLKRPEPQPLPSDYDLFHALKAIRKGATVPYDSAEGTKTDIKIGSVNLNVWSNPEASSETNTQLGDRYVTEKYIESIVNNLKADQTYSSTRLIEQFNSKIEQQNEKIEGVKDKSLSKSGFWTGVSIVIAVVAIIIGFLLHDFQGHKECLNSVNKTVKEYDHRIRGVEEKVGSIADTLSVIKEDLNSNLVNKKKKVNMK